MPVPDGLFNDDLLMWEQLAPLALERRTLTKATALAFAMLCRNIVLERAMSASVLDRGGSAHRGMIQRIDAELSAFDLRPNGKPLYEPESSSKPKSSLSKFLAG